MLRKYLLALGGLALVALGSAHANLLMSGVGSNRSGTVGYSAGGVYLQGEALGYNPYYQKSTALSGTGGVGTISDGGKGIISFWAQCTGSNNGSVIDMLPRCVIGDVMMHSTVVGGGAPSSEAISGLNVNFDTAAPTTAGWGTLRYSDNAAGFAYGSTPEFSILAHNAIGPSDYGAPVHFLIVWDHSTATWCGAMYKNGSILTSTHSAGAAGFSANYSNAAGFVVGSNAEFGTGVSQGDKYNGTLAEVYVNLAPASTPCVSDAIANYSVGSFYSAGNPVDLGTNCATPTGAQPVVCLRWNSAGVTTGNEGYGGTLTPAFAAGMSAAPRGPGQTATAPYLKYIAGSALGVPGATLPMVVEFNNYVPVAGDLIVVYAGGRFSSIGASTISLSTANGFTQAGTTGGGGASNWEVLGVFYKIAVGGDTPPQITITGKVPNNVDFVTMVYGNAHQTTPIGTFGTWATTDPGASTSPATCTGFTPSQSGSLIASAGYMWSTSGVATLALAGNSSNMRYLQHALFHSSMGMYWNDYTNSGTTVVGSATMSASTPDSMACVQFEIKHP